MSAPRRRPPAWVGPARVALVAAVGAGLVLGAARVDGTIQLRSPQAQNAVEEASTRAVTTSSLTCPGPETTGLAGVPAVAGKTSMAAAAAPQAALGQVTPSTSSGSLVAVVEPAGKALGTTSVRGQALTAALSGATAAQLTGVGSLAPAIAGLQTSLYLGGDTQALVATPCLAPRADIWLVAGGGQSARRERIVLANPGANSVTADLGVLGAKGPLTVSGGSDVTVAAHGRTSLLLDALVGAETSPVVHVTTTGGLLTAVVEDSWIDNAVGRGADDAAPTASPADEQVLPVVPVDGPALLRVAVPGDDEAVVQTRALTPNGPVALPSGGVMRVGGETSLDLDLSGLPAGTYAVQVRSDHPVVAGAMTQRRPARLPQSDFAWTSASAPVQSVAGTPVPAGFTGVLSLVSTGSAGAVTVTTVDSGGKTSSRSVAIGADATVSQSLTGPGQVWVTPTSGTVRAGVVLQQTQNATGPLFTAFALEPAAVTGTEVPVHQLP